MANTGLAKGLDSALGALGNGLGELKPILQDASQSFGGAVGDLGGLIPPRTPFQACISVALGGNTNLYAFPQDFLFAVTDEHPYNLDYPWTPAAVVYPRDAHDVSSVVVCASQYGVSVQAKSGGHGYCNFGLGGMDGALSIDLRDLDDFTYNPYDQTVTFGSGNRLADLDKKLAAIDRVMAYGVVGDIGTGGHLAIGGLGPLSRQLGIAADQIVSAECVLGDGRIVTASARENPDLFFAIKGAAWSFAIVTRFTMQTSPPPSEVTSFQYNITVGRVADLSTTFKRWQSFVSDPALSRLFASTLTLTEGLMIYSGTFYGDKESFNRLGLELILPFGQEDNGINIVSSVVTHLIHDLIDLAYDLFGGIPAHFYSNSLKFTPQTLLPDAAVDELFNYIDTADKGTPIWFIVWDLQGGRISDIPQTATAYWHRDALYFSQGYVVNALGPVSQTSKNFLIGFNRICQAAVPVGEQAYAGYVDAFLKDPLTAYWGGNVPRLIQIKGAYGPGNTFRNPQSIPTPWGPGWNPGHGKKEKRHEHKHRRHAVEKL